MLKRLTIIATATLILCSGATLDGYAQTKASKKQTEREGRKTKAPAPAQPVTFYSGDAVVVIKSERHDPIRIGMAAGGVTIIEFPASDKFFAVHPPRNGEWLEIEESPSLKSDTHLVLRAGKDLIGATGPAATLSTQMRSGLVVTFWIYPAKWVSQQTNRMVVKYDREAIIAERRAAGLAVNLGEMEKATAAPVRNDMPAKATVDTTPASVPRKSASEPGVIAEPNGGATAWADRAAFEKFANSAGGNGKGGARGGDENNDKRAKAARQMLADAVGDPKRFKHWSKAVNGLTISCATRDIDEHTKGAVVAVKNIDQRPRRLVPGNPELIIETLDSRGRVLQLSPINQAHSESTTETSLIPAGATVYFAMIYKPQILSKQQRVLVSVAQTDAADEPVVADLRTK